MSTTHRTPTSKLPKAKIHQLTPGTVIRFNGSQVRPSFHTGVFDEWGYDFGDQVAPQVDYTISTVEIEGGYRGGSTGRGVRTYRVTLDDGRYFTCTPQQGAHVVSAP